MGTKAPNRVCLDQKRFHIWLASQQFVWADSFNDMKSLLYFVTWAYICA